MKRNGQLMSSDLSSKMEMMLGNLEDNSKDNKV
jgi:hypothetical protein